jgi:AcrR family transcriptional regulator
MPATRVRGRKKPSEKVLPGRLKPRKSPQQSRSKELVAAILDAASRVLVSQGFDGLTMQAVAKVAGVSPGSLYQYFPDKVSLVTQIIEAVSQREVEYQVAAIARLEPQDLESMIAAMIRSTVAFRRQEGPLMNAAIAAMPLVGHHPLLVERVRQASEGLHLLLQANAARWPGVNVELITHVVVNATLSLTHDGILPRPDWMTDEQLADEAIRLVNGYLKAR